MEELDVFGPRAVLEYVHRVQTRLAGQTINCLFDIPNFDLRNQQIDQIGREKA